MKTELEDKKMPKVSIVMPVYNKQKYLKRSLNSVLNQVFSDFELIAVDDGSTDESYEILKDYQSKDKRINVIHTENYGVSHARNIGLNNIRGEWIQFVDGDDLIQEEYLNKCQKIIAKFDPDIIFTSLCKTDESGFVLERIEVPMEGTQFNIDLQKSFLECQSKTGFYGFVSNKLFKKTLLERHSNRFDESLTLAEDLDFFVRIYPQVEKAYYLSEDSFKYLQTDDNYLKNSDIDYLGQLNIQKRIRQWAVNTRLYGEYKNDVDGSVCRYAAFAVFDAAIKNEDIASICEILLNDETVCKCLDVDYVINPVHKRIISLLKKKDIRRLAKYLEIRETIKRLMRRG